MQFARIIGKGDSEKIYLVVLNTDAATLTTGLGACYLGGLAAEVASADGSSVTASTIGRWPGFVGIAKGDIPSNTAGVVQMWGVVASVLCSAEADKTIGLNAITHLSPSAVAGQMTSTLTAQAASTLLYKYIYNLATTNISGGLNYTKAMVRAI
mgnify:FL=1